MSDFEMTGFPPAPGKPFNPMPMFTYAWNRTGGTVAIGEVLMADDLATQAETDVNANWGDGGTAALAHWTLNLIVPTTAGLGGLLADTNTGVPSIFAVVVGFAENANTTSAGADNSRIEVQWWGPCRAQIAASAVTFGLSLMPVNGVKTLTLALAAQDGVVRCARAQQATGGVAGTFRVWFNGLAGLTGAQQQYAS